MADGRFPGRSWRMHWGFRRMLVVVAPLDGLKRLSQRSREYFIDVADRYDLESLLERLRQLNDVLFILGRDQHGADSTAKRREQFLFQPADRKHPASKSHLARHRDVATNSNPAERRDHRGHHAYTR